MPQDEFITQVERKLGELRRDDHALAAQEEGVRRRRAELRSQMNELQASIRVYREFMGMPVELAPRATTGLFDDIPMGTIADMSYAVVAKNGGPMKVADITRALEELGKLKPDSDGARGNYGSVYGTLKRDRRFRRAGTGSFGIAPTESRNGMASERELPAWLSPDASQD